MNKFSGRTSLKVLNTISSCVIRPYLHSLFGKTLVNWYYSILTCIRSRMYANRHLIQYHQIQCKSINVMATISDHLLWIKTDMLFNSHPCSKRSTFNFWFGLQVTHSLSMFIWHSKSETINLFQVYLSVTDFTVITRRMYINTAQ